MAVLPVLIIIIIYEVEDRNKIQPVAYYATFLEISVRKKLL